MTNNAIDVALFAHKADKQPQQKVLPWSRLVGNLTVHEEREEKDGPLFSPTLYRKGATRGIPGVQHITLLVLDFDKGVAPEKIAPAWDGYEHVIYTTHSHTPEMPKWRAVFPLVQPVPSAEWERVYRNLVTALGQNWPDPSCKDASRIYYLPSCPPGAERQAWHRPGEWLDASAFPDVTPPRPEPPAAAATASIERRNGRVTAESLVGRALERCGQDGRNNAGLWLACQLRDNGYERGDAESALLDYQGRVPDTGQAYTWDEALHSLDQAYASGARDAWEVTRPFSLSGAAKPDDLTGALEIARVAVAALTTDAGSVFTEEALAALGLLRRWDPVNWARLQDEMKRRVKLRDLEKRLDEQNAPVDQEPTHRPRYAGDMLVDSPAPWLVIPGPYVLQETATARLAAADEGGSHLAPIAPAPLLITGRARDTLSGQESLLLTWRHPDAPWRSRIVDRQGALVSRRLAELADYGFPYVEEHAKAQATYLSRLEAANRLTLPCAKVSSHLGWQGNPDDAPFLVGTTLILPDGEIETAAALDTERPDSWRADRIVYHGVSDGEQQIVNAFRSAGTYDEWARTVELLARFPRVMLMFYAAFAAPLLQIWNVPNFVVDLAHATTTGKSTAIRLAASIWGNPDERTPSSLVMTWAQTRVAVERLSSIVNSLPIFLDDTKTSKNKHFVANVVYDVVSGHGRARGTVTGLARVAHWRTILFSTGEQPITSYTQDGGTRTRVLSVRGVPLEQRDLEAGNLAKAVNRRLCEHYGHAGIRWLQWLLREKPLWDAWRGRYDEWVEFYSQQPPTPEAGRLAQYLALVTVAGAMVHEALPLPFQFSNPTLACARDLTLEAGDAAGEERALRDVLSWAYSHERTFHGRLGADMFGHGRTGPVEMSGRWDADDKWEFLAFYPTTVRRVLGEFDYQPESILIGWRERGWLECLPGKFTHRYRIDQALPHMIKIRREAIEALESAGGEQNGEKGAVCSP